MPLSKKEVTEFLNETQVLIERIILQPSLRVASAAQKSKIKFVAPENPKREISSRGLVDQSQKIKNNNSSTAETKKIKEILKVRGGGFLENSWNWIQEKIKAYFKSQKKRDSGSSRVPGADSFVLNNPRKGRVDKDNPKALRIIRNNPNKERSEKKTKPEMGKRKWTDGEVDSRFSPKDEQGKQNCRSQIEQSSFFLKEAKAILNDPRNEKDLIYLMEQCRDGNKTPGSGTKVVPGTCLRELREKDGARPYFKETNGIMEVVAISGKDDRKLVIDTLKSE